jgi:hypothetical protein
MICMILAQCYSLVYTWPNPLLASAAAAPAPWQSKAQEALRAFAEDVYYCSLEYGPQDARTSLGYYNLAKVRDKAKPKIHRPPPMPC